MRDDPFGALGLPASAALSDDEVRAAWKRIAAATHPDREDGGDPARFGAAAAAYATLRTPFGRGEALADLGPARGRHRPPGPYRRRFWVPRAGSGASPRFRLGADSAGTAGLRRGLGAGGGHGRRLALRAVLVLGVTVAAILAVGWTPATIGVLAGALTWAAVTSRTDLGP